MRLAHLYLNALARVRKLTMTRSLLYQFSPVDEDECLVCIFAFGDDSVDELSEDDLGHF